MSKTTEEFEYKSIFINKVEYSFKKKIGDTNSKWVLIDNPMNEKDLEAINKKTKEFIGKAEKRATETNKKREKVQSGIHLESRVNLVFKLYLANLNEYLKANKDKKEFKNVLKTDLVDNIIFDYFKSNDLLDMTQEELIANKDHLAELSDDLLNFNCKGLSYRDMLAFEKENTGLYTDLEIFNKITELAPFFFTNSEGGRGMFVNSIFKHYFIKYCDVNRRCFVSSKSETLALVLNTKFTEKHFQNYFKINKLTNDNFKNI
ncbi:hypothetical protein [Enterococcus casseliflavus]|uniref:hypothetical protein n=1 Tax=Enterococcus casseliflavus TaxID=37734 RepID=UPI00115E26E2|nr:hypothetical protein [Enterococcus casseliflavus]